MHFFGQFTDHNLGRKHGNYTNDLSFFIYSFRSVCNIHFVFETSQNSFSCGPLFGPFWFVKYLNFGQKLPIRTTHHTFLGSRHPKVTKNLYYVLSHEGSQKKVSAHRLQMLVSVPFIKKHQNWVYLWINNMKCYNVCFCCMSKSS